MKNKRGDIPITLLVIGIFAVCGFALVSFYASSIKFSNSFVGIGLMEEINSYIEDNAFKENPIEEVYREQNITEGYLLWKKEKTIFSVKYNPLKN